MHLYLAPWEWKTDPTLGSYWTAQQEQYCIGGIDLRSLPQCGSPGPTPAGLALSLYNRQVTLPNGLYLGDDPTRYITKYERQGISNFFGLGETIVATNLRDAFVELMCAHGDPTGQTRWKPLRGNLLHGYKVALGPRIFQWRWVELDPMFRRAGMEVDHQDWKRLKAANVLVGSVHYRRVLTALAEKYFGKNINIQVIADKLLEAWGETGSVEALPPSTTITDNFNRGDESLDAGPWNETNGNWSVVSNTVQTAATLATDQDARHTTSLSTDAHYAEIIYQANGGSTFGFVGPTVRFAASARTYNRGISRQVDGHYIQKVVTGTITTLASSGANIPTLPVTIRLKDDDADLLDLLNGGVSRLSVTDSSITGNLQAGLCARGLNAGEQGDSFEAADIEAAATSTGRPLLIM